MLAFVAVVLTIIFAVWLANRTFRGRDLKAHQITFGLAVITGVYTVAFFFSMDIPQIIKIVGGIMVGVILIFVAATLQRRQSQPTRVNSAKEG